MKKSLVTVAALAFLLVTSGMAQAGLPRYSEALSPEGENVKVSSAWQSEEVSGRALLPVPAKGKLVSVTVDGAPSDGAELTRVNGENVLLVPLAEDVRKPVNVTAVWTVPGFFHHVAKSGGEGPTTRGDLIPLKYAITNTTALGFESAELSLTLPEGMRLFQVSGKNVSFAQENGVYTVTRRVSGKNGAPGLAPGAKLDLDVSMVPPSGNTPLMLWAAVIVISVLCLYGRRNLMPGRRKQENGAA